MEMQKTVLNSDTQQKSHIWSSATLYPKEIVKIVPIGFTFLDDTRPEITGTEMYNFHWYTQK
jgi:hypothetical protein